MLDDSPPRRNHPPTDFTITEQQARELVNSAYTHLGPDRAIQLRELLTALREKTAKASEAADHAP
jgi:hypothetical protein